MLYHSIKEGRYACRIQDARKYDEVSRDEDGIVTFRFVEDNHNDLFWLPVEIFLEQYERVNIVDDQIVIERKPTAIEIDLKRQITESTCSIIAREICYQLLRNVSKNPYEGGKAISGFHQFLEDKFKEEYILEALEVLCKTNPVIFQKYYLFRDELGDSYLTNSQDFEASKKEGVFYHPHLGTEIENFEDYHRAYFSLVLF